MANMQQEEWIKWEKHFEIGIPVLDEQDKSLVNLCNRLHSEIVASRSGEGKGWRMAFSDALREAVNYTKTHFLLEEKLMAAAGFDGLSVHKNRHQEFIGKVGELLSSFDHCDIQAALDFSSFLHEWIIMHIAREDKLFAKKVLDYLALHKHTE